MRRGRAPARHAATGIAIGLFAAHVSTSGPARAGSLLLSDSVVPDVVTHPTGYQGSATPALVVRVCLVPGTPNVSNLAVPLQNVVNTVNAMTPRSPNLFFGGNNDIPQSAFDVESVLLHEIGHCVGLDHPNLGSVVSSAQSDFTASLPGPNGTRNLGPGSDGLPGSADDQRGDDINLHWFDIATNNPFDTPAIIDETTFSLLPGNLPAGDTFAANADRSVGAALGYPDSEAVMQQLTFNDESQRELGADDVNTLRFAMSGLDRRQGTADDYTFALEYRGVTTQNCDIRVRIDSARTGFAACSVGLETVGGGNRHWQVTDGDVFLNGNINWYFNQTSNASGDVCNGLAVTVDIGAGEMPTPGNDVILGTPGPDLIEALGGNDTICAGGGADEVRGGPGSDTIFGDAGGDMLFGGGDDDVIDGGADDDTVYGQGGGDTINGGAGIDQLFGGPGDDVIDTGSGATVGTSRFASGGAGNDTLRGGADADRLFGVGGNDVIEGNGGNDDIRGGGNDDRIDAGAGADSVLGQAGLDTIDGGSGGDSLSGGLGNDTVRGGGGNDTVAGDANRDALFGEAGNDTLLGGTGDDSLDGGADTDTCDGQADLDTATSCESVSGVP